MKSGVLISVIIVIVLLTAGIFLFSGNNSKTNLEENSQEETFDNKENTKENSPETSEELEPQAYNIEIKDFTFSQKELRIKVGDTIIWTNQDSMQHTATSDSGNEIDSPFLSKGESYSKTFTKTGTFSYHCAPHPNMKGTIIVE